MAFLDNSGDIILDAVLTDVGRERLARGDGSFRITKFAFGDDEIDYSLYQNNNHPDGAHNSGSAYYDIEILQTPVLESFTNSKTSMKSKLISIPRTNVLYLPVVKLAQGAQKLEPFFSGSDSYLIAVDENTQGPNTTNAIDMTVAGIFYGASGLDNNKPITVHQGLDTSDISDQRPLDASLIETSFEVQMDNRLGSLASTLGLASSVSFVDNDNIATYFLSMKSYKNYFTDITNINTQRRGVLSPLAGPRGTGFVFKVLASVELATSTYLFERLGGTMELLGADGTTIDAVRYIDSTIRVKGVTTGATIDIPIRYIKSP